MTQCERIISYISENGSITRAEAMEHCGIANFTARLSDLKKSGIILDKKIVCTKNRYGQPIHYARYRRREDV